MLLSTLRAKPPLWLQCIATWLWIKNYNTENVHRETTIRGIMARGLGLISKGRNGIIVIVLFCHPYKLGIGPICRWHYTGQCIVTHWLWFEQGPLCLCLGTTSTFLTLPSSPFIWRYRIHTSLLLSVQTGLIQEWIPLFLTYFLLSSHAYIYLHVANILIVAHVRMLHPPLHISVF